MIKQGRSHGARHGKTEMKEYHIAWNAWKRCCKKVDSQGGHFTDIPDRFLRDPGYLGSQLAMGWTTEVQCDGRSCKRKTTRTISLQRNSQDTKDNKYLTLNKAGKNGLMKLRSDFRADVLMKNRLHNESGEQIEEPVHPDQYSRWHPVSSASWWDKSEWNWK